MFEHKPSSPFIRNPKLNYVPSGSTRRLVTCKLDGDERGADLCQKQNPDLPAQAWMQRYICCIEPFSQASQGPLYLYCCRAVR